ERAYTVQLKALLPTRECPEVNLTADQVSQLQIRNVDGVSNLVCFTGKKFATQWVNTTPFSYKIKLIKDSASENGKSIDDVLRHGFYCSVVDLIKQIAWLILLSPCALIGLTVKSASFSFKDPLFIRPLKIEELQHDQYPFFAKLARGWQKEAAEKHKEALVNDPGKAAHFEKGSLISRLIAECLEQPLQCSEIFDRLLVVKDDEQRIQAIALTKKEGPLFSNPEYVRDYLKLAHIVTHPHNIRSSINGYEYERVEKAATTLIHHLALECLKINKDGIYAEVVAIAKPFYKKLGFKKIRKNAVIMTEPMETPMVLTKEKIQALFNKTIK
ncbi:MAG: hypothetical protein JWO53_383, partial [Chlamydiia bacterium]|nr:hypothetical protein [Chlamydiia bacterium]